MRSFDIFFFKGWSWTTTAADIYVCIIRVTIKNAEEENKVKLWIKNKKQK